MITHQDGWKLRRNGFTHREIDEIANATDPTGKAQPYVDLSSPAWRATLRTRREWAKDLRSQYAFDHLGKKMPRKVIDQIFDNYIDTGRVRSVFDWLKIEYQPKKRVDFISKAKLTRARRLAKRRARYYQRQLI